MLMWNPCHGCHKISEYGSIDIGLNLVRCDNSIAGGVNRNLTVTAPNIPILSSSFKGGWVLKNHMTAEIHHIDVWREVKISPDSINSHWSSMQIGYAKGIIIFHLQVSEILILLLQN